MCAIVMANPTLVLLWCCTQQVFGCGGWPARCMVVKVYCPGMCNNFLAIFSAFYRTLHNMTDIGSFVLLMHDS